MTSPERIAELHEQARYARERYDLYRAKVYGSRPTSMTRLRELEHAHRSAEDRLAAALRERGSVPPAE